MSIRDGNVLATEHQGIVRDLALEKATEQQKTDMLRQPSYTGRCLA